MRSKQYFKIINNNNNNTTTAKPPRTTQQQQKPEQENITKERLAFPSETLAEIFNSTEALEAPLLPVVVL